MKKENKKRYNFTLNPSRVEKAQKVLKKWNKKHKTKLNLSNEFNEFLENIISLFKQ